MAADIGSFPEFVAALPRSRRDALRLIYGVPEEVPGQELARWLSHPQTVGSVVNALDTFQLQVLEAVLVNPPGRSRASIDMVIDGRATAAQVDAALGRLTELAFCWPIARNRWAANPGLPLVLTLPCGLGPPAAELLRKATVAQLQRTARAFGQPLEGRKALLVEQVARLMRDPELVEATLARLPRAARARLAELCSPGEVLQTGWGFGHPPGVKELIDLGLVVVVDYYYGFVPRELAVVVRGGQILLTVDPEPPVVGRPFAGSLTGAAEAAAASAVADLASLLSAVDTAPPAQLAAGGIGAKEIRRLAKLVGVTEARLAILLHLAEVTDQISGEGSTVTTTPAAQDFGDRPSAQQWRLLVEAWFVSATTSLSVPVLGPPSRRLARELPPTSLLGVLSPDRSCGAADLGRALAWRLPRIDPQQVAEDIASCLAEGELLGLISNGTLTPLGVAAMQEPAEAAALLADRMPDAVREVILQGDLTATSTGPPAAELARLLDSSADRETHGHAVVWRFSAASIRRHLDTGSSGPELLAALAAVAPRGVPSGLSALIDDAARRQGEVSVHAAATVLVTRDAAIAATLLRDRRLAKLNLVGVAESVLITGAAESVVLDLIRKSGFSPSAVRSGPPVVSADLEKLVRTAMRGPRTVATTLLKAVRVGHEATVEVWAGGEFSSFRMGELRVDSTYLSGVSVPDGQARRLRLSSLYAVAT